MLRATLLLTLLAPAEPGCPPEPSRVFLGALVTDDSRYHGRVVEVCGIMQGRGDRDSRERVMYDSNQYSHYWMYVFEADRILPPAGVRTCVTGAFRRRDGYSPAEAEARGLPKSTVTDGLQLPDYVFYPVRCLFDAPARG